MLQKTTPRIPFNLQLSTDERNMLHALIKHSGTSGGAVLRAALRTAYLHTVMNVPTCGNAQPCFVPQMHARQALPPAPCQPIEGA